MKEEDGKDGEYKERDRAYEVASKIGDGVVVENDYPNHIDNSPIDNRMNLIYNSLERKYREAKKGTFTKQLLELDMMFLDKMLAE